MEEFPTPEFHLLPRPIELLKKIGHFVTRQLPDKPFASHGEHTFEKNHGGGPLLDQELRAD